MDQLLATDKKSHLHPFTTISESTTPKYAIERADGVMIFDQTGRAYLDALSGLWCVNAGYNNRIISQAMFQASTEASFAHTMFGASNKYVDRLSDTLIELSPGSSMRKVFFGHSGSDANDTILKLTRLYFLTIGEPQRTNFISRHGSYHGTTLATANLSGLPGHHRNFALPDPSYIHVSAPDTFSALNGGGYESEEDYADWLVAELEDAILKAGAGTVASFTVEPIMAVGGILIPPRTYFVKVREVLDKYGILLVMDDVVCSFGRLGHWFGWETTGVQPEFVAIAKGFTSGYIPMSAAIISEKVWSVFEKHEHEIGVLGHGFTMSGHPVAAAAALANIDVIKEGGLLEAATVKGASLMSSLRKRLNDLPDVAEVRGSGLLIGIQLAPNAEKDCVVATQRNMAVAQICLEEGLVVRAAGIDVIALAPPLIISEAELERIVDVLCIALRRVLDSK